MIISREANELKKLELQLKSKEIDIRGKEAEANVSLKSKKIDSDTGRAMATEQEKNNVQMLYLQEQIRAAKTTEELEALQIQLKALEMNLEHKLGHRELDITEQKNADDNDVAIKQIKHQPRANIKQH